MTKLSNSQQTILDTFATIEGTRYLPVQAEWTKSHEALVSKGFLAFVPAALEVHVQDVDNRKRSVVVTDAGLLAANLDPANYGEDPSKATLMAGVMVKSYHDQYMAQGGGCADNVDVTMREVFMTKSREVQTKKGVRAEPALDVEALRSWGVKIGLWNDRWDALNPGMQRMNLANRVRAKVRKGETIELKGKTLTA